MVRKFRVTLLIPAVVLVVGSTAMAVWLLGSAGMDFSVRGPKDYRPSRPEDQGPSAENVVVTRGAASAPEGFWDRWDAYRGPDLNLVSDSATQLADRWGEDGPKVLWTLKVGDGYGSPASLDGKLFLMDFDHDKQGDALRCLSIETGEEIWRHWYPLPTRGDHGVTRTTPAVTSEYCVAISPQCYVVCVDTATGEYRWSIDLVARYGATVPDWYTGQCPIIDDGKAILAPGGEASMIAMDCNSGEVVWEAPNPNGWKMTHSSITPIEFAGRKMYVYPASGGVVGVDAETGELAWEHAGWIVPTANVPAPVVVGEGKIFLTGGYGAGSRLIELVESPAGGIEVREVYSLGPRVFSAYQQTPIFHKGFLYGVMTKKGGSAREQLVCLEPLEGKPIWSSGKDNRFGWGPYVIANAKIYLCDDEGTLTMARATPEGYEELGEAKIWQAHESWGPPAIVNGRMLLRDLHHLVCVDLRAEN